MNVPAVNPGGLPPTVNQALEPAWVRHGSAAIRQDYESAMAFEQTLVEQLSRTLSASTGAEGESSDEAEGEGGSPPAAGAGALSAMLPQALATGVMNAGGLGLAAQLTQSLAGVTAVGNGTPATATGGGTAAPAGGDGATTSGGQAT